MGVVICCCLKLHLRPNLKVETIKIQSLDRATSSNSADEPVTATIDTGNVVGNCA